MRMECSDAFELQVLGQGRLLASTRVKRTAAPKRSDNGRAAGRACQSTTGHDATGVAMSPRAGRGKSGRRHLGSPQPSGSTRPTSSARERIKTIQDISLNGT